jgi:integrase
MDVSEVAISMKKIDRSKNSGARDYAMLGIFLQTGRRLAEVVNLHWQDVEIRGEQVTLTFHCKGGKTMRDKLPVPLSKALLDWLRMAYGSIENLKSDSPLWISLTRKSENIEGLTIRSVSDICERRLGVSKVHKMRHTWARRMEEEGAKVSDIQARLGHESLATTGRYLSVLKQAENEHADAISKAFGLDD